MKTLIRNALLVVTCDDARTRIPGGDVLLDGPRVVAVGRGLSAENAHVVDATDCLVIPGMVNTHHHLFQTLTRNLPQAQSAALFDWLRFHYRVWERIDPEAVEVSAMVGLGELLLTGCTTSSDHFYLFPRSQPVDLLDFSIEGARRVGSRFHPSRGSMSLGESKGGLPPDSCTQDETSILEDCQRVISKWHDPARFSMCRVVLAPCSPFSVTPELMKQTMVLARESNVQCHTHLAETLDEERFCVERFGRRPVALMADLDWMDPRCWFAHCVHLDEGEVGEFARAGVGVAHCPTSNMRLASGIAPLIPMMKAGVKVGLGVDGSASNDSSDFVGELRSALYVHRLRDGPTATSPDDILWLATRGGARVLGRDDIGQLAPDHAADLAIFDLSGLDHAGSLSDPLAALMFCGASHRARQVWVNGVPVVDAHRLTRIDEKAVARQANQVSARLIAGA